MSVAPLRGLGLISYGLYLWHWPVYVVLTASRTGFHGPRLLLLRLAVSTALATASFVFVESPIRHGAIRSWRGLALGPATAGAIVAATSGAAPAVVLSRVSAHVPAAPATARPAPWRAPPLSPPRHLRACCSSATPSP